MAGLSNGVKIDFSGINYSFLITPSTPLEIMPRCSGAKLRFNKIPAGFNAPLEFLTGFTWIGRYSHHRLR